MASVKELQWVSGGSDESVLACTRDSRVVGGYAWCNVQIGTVMGRTIRASTELVFMLCSSLPAFLGGINDGAIASDAKSSCCHEFEVRGDDALAVYLCHTYSYTVLECEEGHEVMMELSSSRQSALKWLFHDHTHHDA